jgi:hypothetical protein
VDAVRQRARLLQPNAGTLVGWFTDFPFRCGLTFLFLAPVSVGRDGPSSNVYKPTGVPFGESWSRLRT